MEKRAGVIGGDVLSGNLVPHEPPAEITQEKRLPPNRDLREALLRKMCHVGLKKRRQRSFDVKSGQSLLVRHFHTVDREIVACKWDYSHRRGPGRPRVMQRIVNLVLRMALENRSWGYTRIQGAMANLRHELGRGTIANILREYGIDPTPERDKHIQ